MQYGFEYTKKTLLKYEVQSNTGVSKVKLLGTLETWQKLRQATEALNIYGLKWWTDHLIKILDKFIEARKGEKDANFWNNMYKLSKYGRIEHIDGWILNFIPYLNNILSEP